MKEETSLEVEVVEMIGFYNAVYPKDFLEKKAFPNVQFPVQDYRRQTTG